MLTSEQANFHHGFGRAWRQICQPIHITARKKKAARAHRHCCFQFAKSENIPYCGDRKKRHGKCAKRGAKPREYIYRNLQKTRNLRVLRGREKYNLGGDRLQQQTFPHSGSSRNHGFKHVTCRMYCKIQEILTPPCHADANYNYYIESIISVSYTHLTLPTKA